MDPRSTAYFEPSEEAGDAVQVSEAAGVPAHPRAGAGGEVGQGVRGQGLAGGYFGVKTKDEAREALAYFSQRCSNCQWEEACPGQSCAVYRAEKEAIAVIAGVPIRQDIT